MSLYEASSTKQTLLELSESKTAVYGETEGESSMFLSVDFESTSVSNGEEDDDSEAEIDTTTIPARPPRAEPVLHTVDLCESITHSMPRQCHGDKEAPNPKMTPKFGSNTSLSTVSDKDGFDNKSTASSVCESDRISTTPEILASKVCKKCATIKASAEEKIEELKSQLIINESKLHEKDDELKSSKKKFEEREAETRTEINKMQCELSGRLERAVRALEVAKKDKESAVMKYAFVEQDIASKQKTIELCEKRRVACEKEASTAIEKMKQAQGERAKMRQLLESKDNELILARKESDRFKLDIATFNQKLKGSESRVQKEIDGHKETQSKVGLLNQKLKEVKEELDTMKKDCQELIKKYQSVEASRCQEVDEGLKAREEIVSTVEIISDAFKCKDFEYIKKAQKDITDEVMLLREQLTKTKDDLKISESCLRENKDELMLKDAELSALKSRMKAYAVIEEELSAEKAKRIEVESERQREVSLVNDVEQRINDYQCKEKEYLEYTEKLTNKITDLQFQLKERTEEGNKSDSKLQQLRQTFIKLELSISQLKDELKTERETRHEENSLLLQKLEDKTKAFDKLMLDFEEDKNRAAIQNRKMETSLKDVSKQLHQMKRRKEALEQRLAVVSKEKENSKLLPSNGSQSTLNKLKNDVWGGSCDSLQNLDTSSGSAPSVVTTTTDSVDMDNFTSISSYDHSRNVRKSGTCTKGYDVGTASVRSKDSVLETSHSTTSAVSHVKLSSEVSSNVEGSSVRSNVTADVEIAQPFRKGTASSASRNATSGGVVWVDQYPELDKNMLVDKLIRMQKQQNKLREKAEFLEDQVSQLTQELKTKNKVIQYYVLREETGTLGTDTIAFNKLYMLKGSDSKGSANFKHPHQSPLSSIGPHGNNGPVSAAGKLSSLFGAGSNSAEQEHGMQLQKELNARLQSVLEDTILKNIKLQENLDVLSKELQRCKDRLEKDSLGAFITTGEPFSDSNRPPYNKPGASSLNNSMNNKSIASSIKSSNCIAIQRNKHSLIEGAAL